MQVDDAHNIDVVMPVYNLIEYSDNHSKTSGILWQYCRSVLALDDNNAITDFTEANSIIDSFKTIKIITGKTGNDAKKC